MKNSCNITVTATDDKHFIDNLCGSLVDHYSSVQLIALGTEADVVSLKNQYDDIVSTKELSFYFKSDQLILTSQDALYEIRDHLTKFENITFWFNPEFSMPEKELGFLTSISATSLIDHVDTLIANDALDDTIALDDADQTVALDDADQTVAMDETIAMDDLDSTIAMDGLDDTVEFAEIVELNIVGERAGLVAEQGFIDFEAIEERTANQYAEYSVVDAQRAA